MAVESSRQRGPAEATDWAAVTLAAATEIAVLGGANPIAIENAQGEWEIVQYQNAELVSAGRYKLTRLLRGQRGSEHAMRSPVAAGARVLILDGAVVQPGIAPDETGLALTWRVGPASRGGLWGRQRFENVTTWVTAPSGEKGSLKGWEVAFEINLPGSTATDINLAARGSMLSGTLRLDWHHATNRYRMATRQVAYDGASLTDVDELSGGDGTVALTGIVDNAGQIAARFTNTQATARNGGTLTAAFDGLHVIT